MKTIHETENQLVFLGDPFWKLSSRGRRLSSDRLALILDALKRSSTRRPS